LAPRHRCRPRLGGLDAFVACAVEPVQRPILDLTAADWDRALAVNARAGAWGDFCRNSRHFPAHSRT
jgi:NAD(P)-dependent dehydrogenase (short-subunit alcohol dehydrogenase family)